MVFDLCCYEIECFCFQVYELLLVVFVFGYEICLFEYGDVFGDGLEVDVEWGCEFVDSCIFDCQL